MTPKAQPVQSRGRITRVRPAGTDHQVITVEGGRQGYCKKPCADCPWRKDAVGQFPSEAFRHSAPTAYDMSDRVFACHTAGAERTKACAGFLLSGATHNLAVRLMHMRGELDRGVTAGGHELFASYREMAIANGVDPDDPVLAPCR
ncbi:DUF6283 family protein [Luteimonas sp. MHLX1A]|uniref:DUF6283 family protein n=1 Tax=Alterluteimonas muca TaxID=2878684 RepID=UPI001E4C1A91|nr:DUF6283 family protein [Luteimonas sp. MHLX1A]